MIEQGILGEALHFHHPINRPPVVAQTEAAVRMSDDRDNAAVEVPRRPPVDCHLRLAEALTRGRTAVIQVGEADSPLQLEDAGAGEEQDRRVCLPPLDEGDPRPVGLGLRERRSP